MLLTALLLFVVYKTAKKGKRYVSHLQCHHNLPCLVHNVGQDMQLEQQGTCVSAAGAFKLPDVLLC